MSCPKMFFHEGIAAFDKLIFYGFPCNAVQYACVKRLPYLPPVAVYPKKYLNELREEIRGVKARLASGEQPVFDSVDALFDRLEAE